MKVKKLYTFLFCGFMLISWSACNEKVERFDEKKGEQVQEDSVEKSEDASTQAPATKLDESDETAKYALFAKANETGHGSTGTTVRRFAATAYAKSNANFELSDSAEFGTAVRIIKPGFYRLRYVDKLTTGQAHLGFSKNAVGAQLETQIQDLPAEVVLKRVQTNYVNANDPSTEVIWEGHLNSGDVVRAQDQGQCDISEGLEFSIYRF